MNLTSFLAKGCDESSSESILSPVWQGSTDSLTLEIRKRSSPSCWNSGCNGIRTASFLEENNTGARLMFWDADA